MEHFLWLKCTGGKKLLLFQIFFIVYPCIKCDVTNAVELIVSPQPPTLNQHTHTHTHTHAAPHTHAHITHTHTSPMGITRRKKRGPCHCTLCFFLKHYLAL